MIFQNQVQINRGCDTFKTTPLLIYSSHNMHHMEEETNYIGHLKDYRRTPNEGINQRNLKIGSWELGVDFRPFSEGDFPTGHP